MAAVANRDLYIEFVLVDEETQRIPATDAEPLAQLSIGGESFKSVDFPVKNIGNGFYSFVVPGKYIGGAYPISVIATADGTTDWRDIIYMQEFATVGGDLFEREPLPDIEEAEPDDEWGEDMLHNALWQFNDQSAGGRMVQDLNLNLITVTIGPNNGQVRQIFTRLPVDAGTYQMQIVGSATGDYNVKPSIIMHVAPYEHLNNPRPLPEIQMRPDMDAILDFELEPYDPARVRIIFPNTIPEGTIFNFDAITLRKKVR